MCAAIMELSNALIYGHRLRCGSSQVEKAKIKYTALPSGPTWIKEALNPDRPVVFINTDLLLAFETNDRKAVNNPMEANIIAEIVPRLLSRGILEEDIGIITPYNSQADLIRQSVSTSVEIHTIDKYQVIYVDVITFLKNILNLQLFLLKNTAALWQGSRRGKEITRSAVIWNVQLLMQLLELLNPEYKLSDQKLFSRSNVQLLPTLKLSCKLNRTKISWVQTLNTHHFELENVFSIFLG